MSVVINVSFSWFLAAHKNVKCTPLCSNGFAFSNISVILSRSVCDIVRSQAFSIYRLCMHLLLFFSILVNRRVTLVHFHIELFGQCLIPVFARVDIVLLWYVC